MSQIYGSKIVAKGQTSVSVGAGASITSVTLSSTFADKTRPLLFEVFLNGNNQILISGSQAIYTISASDGVSYLLSVGAENMDGANPQSFLINWAILES